MPPFSRCSPIAPRFTLPALRCPFLDPVKSKQTYRVPRGGRPAVPATPVLLNASGSASLTAKLYSSTAFKTKATAVVAAAAAAHEAELKGSGGGKVCFLVCSCVVRSVVYECSFFAALVSCAPGTWADQQGINEPTVTRRDPPLCLPGRIKGTNCELRHDRVWAHRGDHRYFPRPPRRIVKNSLSRVVL